MTTSEVLSTFLHWWKPWWLQWSQQRVEPLCDLSLGHLQRTIQMFSMEMTWRCFHFYLWMNSTKFTWRYCFRVVGIQALTLCVWFLCPCLLRNNEAWVGRKNGWGDHCVVCWKMSNSLVAVQSRWTNELRQVVILKKSTVTFNPFPEVIAVPSYRCEFTQVMVSAPDVHVLILWAADYEGVVVAVGR